MVERLLGDTAGDSSSGSTPKGHKKGGKRPRRSGHRRHRSRSPSSARSQSPPGSTHRSIEDMLPLAAARTDSHVLHRVQSNSEWTVQAAVASVQNSLRRMHRLVDDLGHASTAVRREGTIGQPRVLAHCSQHLTTTACVCVCVLSPQQKCATLLPLLYSVSWSVRKRHWYC